MKPTVMLHEFMPYGAPDLIRAQRPDLSRALALSSSFAIFTLVGLALLTPLIPNPRVEIVIPKIYVPVAPMLNPAQEHRPAAAKIAGAKPLDSKYGAPKVVHDDRTLGPETPPWYDDFAQQVQPGAGELSAPSTGGPGFTPTIDPDAPATYVEEMPVSITEVKPDYPQVARDAMVDGLVVVLVLVGRDGRVREAKVDAKNSIPLLDQAALESAKKWVFSPALANGHPVAVWTAIPFHFVLQ
jgi:protein TonB